MFTAKKIRLHGMVPSKWSTKDKITQYKGLINLYTRDRKIIEIDTNVSRKKTQRELKDIAKTVHADRHELDNAIRGDKQALRNTLSDHKELQLAYQNSQPKKVIEQIDQLNFNKRKILDKLKYDKMMKSKRLIDLKLEQALLEDRLKYAYLGQIKEEKEAQIITGKVQDAILRKEAAWSIYHIYREILDIMKKDALYFDAIIASVRSDAYSQSRCFLGATKLGQLATEYLDDRRQEYDTLEKIILKDMTTRKTDIKILSENVENAMTGLKQLLRKDSDITTCALKTKETSSLENLHKDVTAIEKTLTFLKHTTAVPSFEAIYPCLKQQMTQRRRLRYLLKKCEFDKDTLLNKTNHAQLMNNVLKTTANDEISEYRIKKQEFTTTADALKQQKEQFMKNINAKRKVAANIRIALRQLLQLSFAIKQPELSKKPSQTATSPYLGAQQKAKKLEESIEIQDEIDGSKIVPILLNKFSLLMAAYNAKQKETKLDEAYKQFELLMQERTILFSDKITKISQSSLLQGFYTDSHHQLTREDIKKQSEEIVALNTKNEDLIPLITIPTKKKFKLNQNRR